MSLSGVITITQLRIAREMVQLHIPKIEELGMILRFSLCRCERTEARELIEREFPKLEEACEELKRQVDNITVEDIAGGFQTDVDGERGMAMAEAIEMKRKMAIVVEGAEAVMLDLKEKYRRS